MQKFFLPLPLFAIFPLSRRKMLILFKPNSYFIFWQLQTSLILVVLKANFNKKWVKCTIFQFYFCLLSRFAIFFAFMCGWFWHRSKIAMRKRICSLIRVTNNSFVANCINKNYLRQPHSHTHIYATKIYVSQRTK